MKKIILFLLLICSVVLLLSCSKNTDKKDTPEQNDEIDYSEYFLNSRRDAELCYLSYFGCDGFGSYIMAYPEAAIEHMAEQEGVDYDSFANKAESECDKLGENRLALYEKEFDVGYTHILDEKIEGRELKALKESISEYGIDTDSITEAVRGRYNYVYFTRQERVVNEDGSSNYNFGEIPENAEILYQSTVVFTLIYIEDEGWFVSPEDYLAV